MALSEEEKIRAELEKGFGLLTTDPMSEARQEELKARDKDWKKNDPDGYKKDMEKMCKAMFGDAWEVEYDAMLREEFPEEFEDQGV
jgi:hypothetical protein